VFSVQLVPSVTVMTSVQCPVSAQCDRGALVSSPGEVPTELRHSTVVCLERTDERQIHCTTALAITATAYQVSK